MEDVVNTRGFALDACIPLNSTRYIRFTCNSHHAIGAFYNSPNCAVGTETSGLLEEFHILNQCTPLSSERWTMYRCTSDVSTLPIFADSMLSAEYATSGCDLEPVAFQTVPTGICNDFDSVGSYSRFDCEHGQLYETRFEDSQCMVGGSELPVEKPSCMPNTGPQGLRIAYSKRECFLPMSSEPNVAISVGYFYRNLFRNAECDGPPVYQDGFRLERCLPLYSTQGISEGSYYGKCTINNNDETLLEYITFKNMNCAGPGVSSKVRVGVDTCHESSPPIGIQQGMHSQFHCSSEGTIEDFPLEHRIPNAIVLGGVEDQIVCNNLESYNVFAVYSTNDRFGTKDWSFSLTCNSQTWYNSSENTVVSFSLETDPGSSCKSTESTDYKSLVTNQWHLAQMFWLSSNFTGSTVAPSASIDEILSTNLISRQHGSSSKDVRKLSEGSTSDVGWALRTYYSDSQCYGMEVLFVGYRLDTCIPTFNASSGKATGSVKYTCDGYDDTFVFASTFLTPDCSDDAHQRSLFDGPVGQTEVCDNQNFDLIHGSAEGVFKTYISRAQSRAWTCTPGRVLPVQTDVILTKGFGAYDDSCSSDAMPLFFTAFPTENCMALNGTLLESVRYTCLDGKPSMSTYSGSFCQESKINHAPVGNLSCTEGYVKNQLENTSPQAYQTTSCYNPATAYFGGDKNYYYGGDDLWLDKFSFVNVMCRSVSTDLETSAPTDEPTAIPSKRSKPTRSPTSVPTFPLTDKPIGGEVIIFFAVTQGISGCSLSTFTTFLELYTRTFKETVTASINSSFVTSKSITNMIASGDGTFLPIHRRLGSTRLTLHYSVKTTVPSSAIGVNSASLSTALVDSVQNGHFNSLLSFYASVNGANGLLGARSESISVTFDVDNPSGSALGGLSETDMIVAVVFALAGVGCLLTCCYRARRGGGNNCPPCCVRRSSRSLSSSIGGGAYRGRRGSASAYDGYSYEEDAHGLAERGFDEIPPLTTSYSPRLKIHGRRLGAKSFDSEL